MSPASWPNQAGHRFADPGGMKLQRGAHRSVVALDAGIVYFIDAHDEKPKPRERVRSADEIPASVRRFRRKANEPGWSGGIRFGLVIRKTRQEKQPWTRWESA